MEGLHSAAARTTLETRDSWLVAVNWNEVEAASKLIYEDILKGV